MYQIKVRSVISTCFLLLSVMVGCSNTQIPQLAGASAAPTNPILPPAIFPPTSTVSQKGSSPQIPNPESEITPAPETQLVIEDCGPKAYSPNIDFVLKGELLYWDRAEKSHYIMVGSTGHKTKLSIPAQPYASVIGFSPDGKWLAYLTGDEASNTLTNIVLLSGDGKVQENKIDPTHIPTQVSQVLWAYWGNLNWINNQLVEIDLPNNNALYPPVHMLLNPFVGEWKTDLGSNIPPYHQGNGVYASPDLTHGVTFLDDHSLEVWDLRMNTQISRWPIYTYQDSRIWSPDGQWIAFVGVSTEPISQSSAGKVEDDVFLLNRDGKTLRRVTDFHKIFSHFSAQDVKFSPNGQYLAISASVSIAGEDSHHFLYIYNIDQNILHSFCWAYADSITSSPLGLFWSPDSKQIAYSAGYVETVRMAEPTPILLLQVDDTAASPRITEIIPSGFIEGWSDQF